MFRIPAPALRALSVLAIGATLVTSHAVFAAPASGYAVQLSAGSKASARDRQAAAPAALAENCYLDRQVELTPTGKTVTRVVQECD